LRTRAQSGTYRFLRPPFADVFRLAVDLGDGFAVFLAPEADLRAPPLTDLRASLLAGVRPPFADFRAPPLAVFREACRDDLFALRDPAARVVVVFLRAAVERFARPIAGVVSPASVVLCAVSPIGAAVSGIRTSSFG
jgi:hypothetical protein